MNKILVVSEEGTRVVCPIDLSQMSRDTENRFECNSCGRIFYESDGVVRLLETPDEFYEGAYQNQVRFKPKTENIFHVWPLWLISNGYPWYVRKHVDAGATVVELGCAGGVNYFGTRYRMVGVDVSFRSLANSCSNYELKIQADASQCIPLQNNSVDAVISSYFWEHIPPEMKSSILDECKRILRPGGKLIFLYDVETSNPLLQRVKIQNPDEYKRLFIDGDGHFGYQKPSENLAHFLQHGFRIVEHRGMEKTPIQSPSVYTKLKTLNGMFKSVFSIAERLGGAPWFYPYTFLVRLIDFVVCPWLPDDWARIDLVVMEKGK